MPVVPRPDRVFPVRIFVVLAAAVLALAGCREPASPWAHERIARMTLRQKVAQMVAPAVYVGADARLAQDTLLANRVAAEELGGCGCCRGPRRWRRGAWRCCSGRRGGRCW